MMKATELAECFNVFILSSFSTFWDSLQTCHLSVCLLLSLLLTLRGVHMNYKVFPALTIKSTLTIAIACLICPTPTIKIFPWKSAACSMKSRSHTAARGVTDMNTTCTDQCKSQLTNPTLWHTKYYM
jgi:hypothetical protein